jgi:ADP-heptose:LPS heptosyltransferase
VLAAVLARAGLYVGNDSGVSHLAAAAGCPTVALFGPTDPALWSPVGPRVRAIRSRTGAMDGLAIDEVLGIVRDV